MIFLEHKHFAMPVSGAEDCSEKHVYSSFQMCRNTLMNISWIPYLFSSHSIQDGRFVLPNLDLWPVSNMCECVCECVCVCTPGIVLLEHGSSSILSHCRHAI